MRGLTNQKGLTLLEVLAAVTIISIIIVLLYGILFNSKEQYNSQTEKNEQLSDISYALKVITKDIRKSGTLPEIKQNDEKKIYKIGDEEYIYDNSVKKVTRNGVIFIQQIINFDITPITKDKYKIQIENTRENLNTEIVIRSEH